MKKMLTMALLACIAVGAQAEDFKMSASDEKSDSVNKNKPTNPCLRW